MRSAPRPPRRAAGGLLALAMLTATGLTPPAAANAGTRTTSGTLTMSATESATVNRDPRWRLLDGDENPPAPAPSAVPTPPAGPAKNLRQSPSGPWSAALPGPARVVAERRLGPRTLDILISSPAVDALLPVRLLVPKGWSKTARRTWPVLYLLHGGADNYTSWTRMTDVADFTAGMDAIVVMPEAGRAGNYSDWYNKGRGGPPAWETFHLSEVRQLLEIGYRAGTRRAVAGLSMGAYGAMKYAARHPGMFEFAGAYSGVMATRIPGMPAFIMNAQASEHWDPLRMWGDPLRNRDVWAANDPNFLAGNLRGTALYISSGTNSFSGPLDPPGAPWNPAYLGEPVSAYTARALAASLRRYGIPFTLNLYGNGTHTWPYWRREFKASFPMILNSLGLVSR
ncbi:alpha/beta hydrolase family protein [Sphaerisporangium flaviroseum]|uniref:Alpha/beta hydrolase family protein n=1 Tax=Sphaerisporangium flaviroseum TaxID=509199 RepID=A0ABP7I278_9ACTN